MLPYSLIFLMTIMGSVASLFLKKAADSMEGDSLIKAAFGLLKAPSIYIGVFLYGAAAVLNIVVLHFLDYSIVLPLTAFTYVWTIILARVRLKEAVSVNKVIGICLVVAGAVLVSRF